MPKPREAVLKVTVRERGGHHPLPHDVHRAVRNMRSYADLYGMDVTIEEQDDNQDD